ncbi:MAG: DUF3095 domain-containing protein [Cyanobacteria bacterium P01_F01_bin.86]
MSSADFYTSLLPLDRFLDLADPDLYTDVPEDWYVLITDVVGSTQAIDQGKYKEVNMVGASSIIAVLNALDMAEIPFVFGGDGASLLVPPWALHAAREALLSLRTLARKTFQLELRVGVVPVAVVTQRFPLQVAKIRLTPYCNQSSFIGGGLTYATDLVKKDERYQLTRESQSPANLRGLECHWQDIPSLHGHMVSLIVAALPSDGQSNEVLYQQVIKAIQRIYGDEQRYRPVTPKALELTFNPRKLILEVKAKTQGKAKWLRILYLVRVLIEILIGHCFMVFNVKFERIQWGRYKEDLCAASDYQKIDDALRMVISGTSSQTNQLAAFLEQQKQDGKLLYGMHVSDRALMTCMFMARRDHHIHFIDGADGGYALAARALKKANLSQETPAG